MPVPGGGGRLCLWRQPRLHRRAGRRRGPVRAGPQAPQGHLGAGRAEPTPRSRRPATWAGSGSSKPGRWRRVTRRFRDGHTETWWAADAQLGGWGPDRRTAAGGRHHRPGRLPGHSTWYLVTNLPRPATRRAQQAELADIVRLYGLRNWVEQGYKQVKGELGWADFQVRIRPRDPPALDAGVLCVQLLLAGLPRRPPHPTSTARPAGRPDGRAGGAGDRASTPNQPSGTRGRWRCERCGPG